MLMPAYLGNNWGQKTDGVYTVKSGYEWLTGHDQKIYQNVRVWNGYYFPKYSFVCQLIRLDKIKTKEKLKNVGITDSIQCPVCDSADETCGRLNFLT